MVLSQVFQMSGILLRWIRYYFRSTTVYRLHSPFLYDLANRILEDHRVFYAFRDLEKLREKALRDGSRVHFHDPGAGSLLGEKGGLQHRTIRDIARYSVSTPAKCRLLFNIVQWAKPAEMLELGTSLGITAMYQQLAARNARLTTLEGVPVIARIAKAHFEMMHLAQIRIVEGLFDDTLPDVLRQIERLDYVFIDGNHQKSAVLTYFELCLTKSHPKTVIVIDDIHWSNGMREAWDILSRRPDIACAIDLFQIGIVLFSPQDLPARDQVWIPSRYKPWSRYI